MAFGKPYSVFLKGNLKNVKGRLEVKLPYSEMRYNLWQISLINLSYECLEDVNILGYISSNYITDICIKDGSEITYNPHLNHCLLKGSAGEKKCVYLNQNWIYINSFNETLFLNFRKNFDKTFINYY